MRTTQTPGSRCDSDLKTDLSSDVLLEVIFSMNKGYVIARVDSRTQEGPV
jgi:hypothetical protein